MKPQVLHWIWNLSLGGDAKNLCALAMEQQSWADVVVLTRSAEPGVRAAELESAGIKVITGIDSSSSVATVANQSERSILIMHRNGRPDEVETAVLGSFQKLGMPTFEFNTFGRVDSSTDALWTGHFFPSRTCLTQYAERLGVPPLKLTGHSAPGYSLRLPPAPTPEEKLAARWKLGIPAGDFAIIRMLRPDLRKWDPMPVLAVQRLLRLGCKVHLVIQTAPPQRAKWIKNILGEAVMLLDTTDDAVKLRQTLAAGDCLVNYSHIGETFGLAMAEGMACELPVLVNSTPKMDNAQIEMCTHGVTGLVANSLGALTSALQLMIEDPDYTKRMGTAARKFMAETFSVQLVEPRVRRFILETLPRRYDRLVALIPAPPVATDNYHFDKDFLQELRKRAKQQQPSSTSSFQDFKDRQYLSFLGALDNFEYARSMGSKDLAAALASRLKNASLTRK